MNIIIKGGSKKTAPGSTRPARFGTRRGVTTEEVREIVRAAADEYGPANERMMGHEAYRSCVTHSGEFDHKKFEEATHEIARVMNPDNDPHVKSTK